ncbi:MAG: GAF domain-containing sensor histidine kinase [Armatimonadota bacterium]|nr:GAF domain-containing sensor histidine kinase [Armatimonadota bacterium]
MLIQSGLSDSAILGILHRIATRLFARPRLDEILPEALLAAMESVGAQAGSLFLHDPKDDTLVFRHVVGGAGESLVGLRIPANQGLAGHVFQTGQPCVTGDASQDPRQHKVAADFQTRSMVTVPLSNLEGRTIGVMQVLNKADGGTFSNDHDLSVLETLAGLAATAIENAQALELERKAAVADQVGFIAHDIKNMMTPVESWAGTLEWIATDSRAALDRLAHTAKPEDAETLKAVRELFDILPEALDGIREGANQAKDRGAEIADALKGNVRQPCFVVEDVAKTISRVCHTLKGPAAERGVSLEMTGKCPPFPHDRTHVFNALYNLVNNAIPYVSLGGSIIVDQVLDNDYVEIKVIDTGKGMPEDVRLSLFTDNAKSTTPGGTGLGTRIVARVAAAHQGTITVKSKLGKGTTFVLRLPTTQPEAPTK